MVETAKRAEPSQSLQHVPEFVLRWMTEAGTPPCCPGAQHVNTCYFQANRYDFTISSCATAAVNFLVHSLRACFWKVQEKSRWFGPVQLKTPADGSVPTLQIQAWQVSGQGLSEAVHSMPRHMHPCFMRSVAEGSCLTDPCVRVLSNAIYLGHCRPAELRSAQHRERGLPCSSLTESKAWTFNSRSVHQKVARSQLLGGPNGARHSKISLPT